MPSWHAEISWNSDLTFGIAELDFEHRHLVTSVNYWNQAIARRSAAKDLEALFNQVVAETRTHFLQDRGAQSQEAGSCH